MPINVANTFLEYLFQPDRSLPLQWKDEDAVVAIVDCCRTTGGATFSLYFGDQAGQSLYAVGLDNNLTRTIEPEALQEGLMLFIQMHRETLTHPRCCIGVWQAPDADGSEKAWLDIAVLVYNEARAWDFAQAGNQIAFFDLRPNGAGEIAIGGTGESSLERLSRLNAQDIPE